MARKKQEPGSGNITGRSDNRPYALALPGGSAMVHGRLVAVLGRTPGDDPFPDITFTAEERDCAEGELGPNAEAPLWQLLLASKLGTVH